jgi:hypothetical protein
MELVALGLLALLALCFLDQFVLKAPSEAESETSGE